MEGRTYGFECPVTSTTNVSSYSANATYNISLDPGLFRQDPQGLPSVFDKSYTPGPHPPMQPTLLQFVDESHLGSPSTATIHQEGLKASVIPVHPSGSLSQTTFIKFINSSEQGCKLESVWPVTISPIANSEINLTSSNRICDSPQEGVSIAPLTLPVISCGKPVVQDKQRRVPNRPRQVRKTKTHPAAALPQSSPSLRPGKKPGVSRGRRYSCGICHLDYAQPQGLSRHQSEKHKARLCIYCREFAWGRLYLFKEHLGKRHPDIDLKAAIDEVARTLRSATIRRSYPPLPPVPIPTAKCDSWNRAESQSHLSQPTSSLPRPSTVTRLSPFFMPTETAYQSQSESAEPENRETHGQGDILSFELLSANDEHPVSPSTAEHVEAATNLDMYARDMQMWFKDKKQSINPTRLAAADSVSPALARFPTPTPPVNGYNESSVVVSHVFEQAEHRYSYHPPPASVVERSGRMPWPLLPIGCNWTNIWLAETHPEPNYTR